MAIFDTAVTPSECPLASEEAGHYSVMHPRGIHTTVESIELFDVVSSTAYGAIEGAGETTS